MYPNRFGYASGCLVSIVTPLRLARPRVHFCGSPLCGTPPCNYSEKYERTQELWLPPMVVLPRPSWPNPLFPQPHVHQQDHDNEQMRQLHGQPEVLSDTKFLRK